MKWIKGLLTFFSIGYYRLRNVYPEDCFKVGQKILCGDGKIYKITAILKNDIIIKIEK